MGGTSGASNGDAVPEPPATLLLARENAFAENDGAVPLDLAPERSDVLVVSVARTVAEVVREWRTDAGTLPPAFGLVTFAEFERSAATASEDPPRRSLPGHGIRVTTMSEPTNLRRLATAITLYLDDWDDTGRETFVYVDTLEPFLDGNGLESTFQFLHLLVQTVAQRNAAIVVRLDPNATEERAINTLRPLFGDVIDVEAGECHLDYGTLDDLLDNQRRRFVLRTLLEDAGLGLDQLATRLARREAGTHEPTDRERDRAYTALASVHVPRLAEAGLVVFDRSAKRVRLSDAARESDCLERRLDESSDD
ncbi:MAG: hypothetical protein ABEI80_03175 [Haloplanus sp.]